MTHRITLIGVGTVGQGLLQILRDRGGEIASRYRGAGGPAYVKNVHSKYGGVTIVTLQPTRLRAWASET